MTSFAPRPSLRFRPILLSIPLVALVLGLASVVSCGGGGNLCGNGFVDVQAGETCDPQDPITSPGCDPNTCLRLTSGNAGQCTRTLNGVADPSCTPGVTAGCVETVGCDPTIATCVACAATTSLCAGGAPNGVLDAGEECDPTAPATTDQPCAADCRLSDDDDDGGSTTGPVIALCRPGTDETGCNRDIEECEPCTINDYCFPGTATVGCNIDVQGDCVACSVRDFCSPGTRRPGCDPDSEPCEPCVGTAYCFEDSTVTACNPAVQNNCDVCSFEQFCDMATGRPGCNPQLAACDLCDQMCVFGTPIRPCDERFQLCGRCPIL